CPEGRVIPAQAGTQRLLRGARTNKGRTCRGFRPLERPGPFLLLAQKKGTKEKGLSRRSEPVDSVTPGFFDRPSVSCRKTAGVLPAALRVCMQHGCRRTKGSG